MSGLALKEFPLGVVGSRPPGPVGQIGLFAVLPSPVKTEPFIGKGEQRSSSPGGRHPSGQVCSVPGAKVTAPCSRRFGPRSRDSDRGGSTNDRKWQIRAPCASCVGR